MAERRGVPLPFLTQIRGDELTVVFLKDFDLAHLHQDWVRPLLSANPGPFERVRIDLGQRGPMNSAFYAGLVQLHHTYVRDGRLIELVQPDPRLVDDLRSMRLDTMFTIHQRAAR